MNMYIYGHNRCITSIKMHNMNTNYMILSFFHSRVMYNLQTEEKISTKFPCVKHNCNDQILDRQDKSKLSFQPCIEHSEIMLPK